MNQLRKQKPDLLLSLLVFSLIAFGLIMIYSVSKYYSLQISGTDKFYLKKQIMWSLIGLVSWAVFQSIDYRFWQKHSAKMLPATIALLILPFIFHGGDGSIGSRWVNIFGIGFQPAELAKLTMIIYLAGWFSSKGSDPKKIQSLFIPFLLFVGGIALMMLIQKDLGTLSIILAIAAGMFVVTGTPIWHLFAGGGAAAFLLWLAIKIEPYRLKRLTTFLNPEEDALGAGYHIRNALIAIGSGGLWGLGFGQSKQKYLYLPEAHTDSIFAITCEELGFLRSSIVIVVFILIAIRGYKIAMKAPDIFSRLLATGITTWFFIQMLVNIAAMLSLIPLTGVPLPFVSYGGSSLLVLLTAVGILINISKYRGEHEN